MTDYHPMPTVDGSAVAARDPGRSLSSYCSPAIRATTARTTETGRQVRHQDAEEIVDANPPAYATPVTLAPDERTSPPSYAVARRDRGTEVMVEDDTDRSLRLPSAWYSEPIEATPWLTPQRQSHLLRGTAVGCIATATCMLVWLGLSDTPQQAPAPSLISSFAPGIAPVAATPPAATAVASRNLVTTAQILAVAERFVATAVNRPHAAAAEFADDPVAADAPRTGARGAP